MIDELRARFGARFLEIARGRIRRSLELMGRSDGADQLITELHSLAGESSMLGLEQVAEMARNGEEDAKQWKQGSTTAKLYCARTVRTLSQRIEELASSLEEEAGASAGNATDSAAGNATDSATSTEEPGSIAGGQDSSQRAATDAPDSRPAAPLGDNSASHSLPGRPLRSEQAGDQEAAHGAGRRDLVLEHRVLIIDDSRLSGEHLSEALATAGIDSRLAMNRDAALAEFVAFAPQLVVCDVHMPGVDLHELCSALRRQAPEPVTIALLSGMSDAELARRARAVGADSHVSKHAGIDQIVSHLVSLLGERHIEPCEQS
ncbi:MAG: response regulator [Proteobacteria bacterium]|nr:response regulator [Pseudomonadota bacterium]